MPAWPPPFMICNSFTEVWLSGFISWGLSLQASSPCYTSFKGCFVQQDPAVVCLVKLGVPTAPGAGVRGESGTGSITWVGLWFWGFDGSVVGMQVCASSCTRVQLSAPVPMPAEGPWLWVNPGAEMHFPGCGSGYVQLDTCCLLAFRIPTWKDFLKA